MAAFRYPGGPPVQDSARNFIVVALGLFLAAGIVLVMIYARALLVPLAAAVVLWLLINALSTALYNLRPGGFGLPGAICLTVAILIVIGVVIGISNIIAASIADMTTQSDDIEDKLDAVLKRYAVLMGISDVPTVQTLIKEIDPTRWSSAIVGAISGTASTAVTIVIYIAFLLVEQNYFDSKMRLIFRDEERREQVREMLAQMGQQIRTYALIKTWLAVLVGLIAWAIMAAVGLKFAPFFAFLAFLGYYIPTIGPIVAILFPVMFAVVQFNGFSEALIILVVSGGLQIGITNAVEPRFMSKSLNVSMFVMVFALFAFGAVWGIVGMFLAVPILVILMIVLWNMPPTRPIAIALSQNGRVVPDQN
jgi:predicted PurR-regulated permease PerM